METGRDRIYQMLSEVFGFDAFWPAQEAVVNRLLQHQHTLAVMPTGSGKSLCYQLPALLMPNFSIVVSPMISLMKDQVMQMQAIGVKAAMYHSGMDAVERGEVLTQLQAQDLKLLYVAPETLTKESFLQNLDPAQVDLLAVDEAHCISIWGHDFRPEYRMLGELVSRFPRAVRFALTATATPKVRQDICKVLGIPPANQFVESFNRKNLMLAVQEKYNAQGKLLNFLNSHAGESGLIYCLTRKRVDSLADKLAAQGFSVLPYHAGLPDEERRLNQEKFIHDEVRIVVATIAFGMGINKSNIRYVVHYDLPKNIETYYQEIGRSGRDGLPSVCLLLFGYQDLILLQKIIALNDNPDRRKVYFQHLDALMGYINTSGCRRKPLLNWFGESYQDGNCQMCDNCLDQAAGEMDASIQAQKFLSAVYRTGQIFGSGHIIDLLRGSQNKKIKEHRHDELSVHGIGREWSREEWYSLFTHLRSRQLLEVEATHGSVVLNEQSWEILRQQRQVMIPQAVNALLLATTDQECNLSLFELLQQKRFELAHAKGLPPYILFSDTSLREMAIYLPHSPESLLRITGVGQKKLQDYGEAFLELIRGFCREHGLQELPHPGTPKLPKPDTSKSTQIGEYLAAGHSLQQAMLKFDLKQETLLRHVQSYLKNGGRVEPEAFWEASLLPEADKAEIAAAFDRLGLDFLRPLKDEFGEKYTYHDLRLIQLHLLAKLQGEEAGAPEP